MEQNSDLQDQVLKNYDSDLGVTETQTVTLPGIITQSGYEFSSLDICYMTLGTLNEREDNAILVCHALSGNAHLAGIDSETGRPGWWDFHVGPGKTIDTDQFFVICSNVIGGCNGSTGPTSINPATGEAYGIGFPPVTIRDMVAAQTRLIDFLGIEKLFAVIGGSMGGMQALAWTIDHSDRIENCIPIATCMAHSAQQIAFNEVGRQAILSDPQWKDGNYTDEARPEHGLAVARMVAHITYLSEYSMQHKFGRKQQRSPMAEDLFPVFFSVESYLQYQGESFVRRFDANSYLYITKAIDMFDLLERRATEDVFRNVKARFLVLSFESDWLYPPSQSRELVRALKRSNNAVSYSNLETPNGHDSFLIFNPELTRVVRTFLLVEYRKKEARLEDEAFEQQDNSGEDPSQIDAELSL